MSAGPRNILVIDPEPFMRELFKLKLEPLGAKIFCAEDEREIKKEILERKPDLIILDILHPKIDSYKFVQSLKNNPRLEPIKVIIVSFKKRDPATFFLYNVWVEAFFEKPFIPENLVKKVKQIFSSLEAS